MHRCEHERVENARRHASCNIMNRSLNLVKKERRTYYGRLLAQLLYTLENSKRDQSGVRPIKINHASSPKLRLRGKLAITTKW